MPGNPDEPEPPVADREVLPPPDSPDDSDADEEEDETPEDAEEPPDGERDTSPEETGEEPDEEGDETADSEDDEEEPEPGDAPDEDEGTVDDPDLAPQADLTESWTDEPPAQYRTEGSGEPGDDEEREDEGGDEEADGSAAEESGDGDEEDQDEDEVEDEEDGGEDQDEDEVEDEEDGGEDQDEDEVEDEEDGGENQDEDEVEDEEDGGEDQDEDEVEDEEDEDDDDDSGTETVDFHDDATPIERKTGPESDTEQPLADHIEEMIRRLAVVVVVAGLVSLAAFPFGEDFIVFLWYSVLPADVSQPHVYHPLELVITQLKAASLLGLVLALPVFVYETYAFMRPGLYPHERRYYLAAVPTSLVLAAIGLLFGYFLVLPAVMTYFLYYSRDVVDIAFALGQTFNLMLILLGYLALVFQIPLFIMLAIMMGLTTRTWLEDRRLIFWGAFLGISFLFSPDPTGMAPILVAATMIALFEGTLLLLRWTRRGG